MQPDMLELDEPLISDYVCYRTLFKVSKKISCQQEEEVSKMIQLQPRTLECDCSRRKHIIELRMIMHNSCDYLSNVVPRSLAQGYLSGYWIENCSYGLLLFFVQWFFIQPFVRHQSGSSADLIWLKHWTYRWRDSTSKQGSALYFVSLSVGTRVNHYRSVPINVGFGFNAISLLIAWFVLFVFNCTLSFRLNFNLNQLTPNYHTRLKVSITTTLGRVQYI